MDHITVYSSTCPGCGDDQLERLSAPLRRVGDPVFEGIRECVRVDRCQGCGLAFVNPRPSDALLNEFYSSDDYVCHGAQDPEGARHKAQAVFERIERHLPNKGRLLDFGMGSGFLLEHGLERGWEAMGYDVGQRALAECRAKGLRVTDNLGELPDDGFDAIVLHHVFEHIPDLGQVLDQLRKTLSPTGLLFIEVPNGESLRARLSLPLFSRLLGFDERYRAFPIHLYYFDNESMSTLLRRHGLCIDRADSYGLGIDELFYELPWTKASNDDAEAKSGTVSEETLREGHGGAKGGMLRQLIPQGLRDQVKQLLYERLLGEHLFVAARRDDDAVRLAG